MATLTYSEVDQPATTDAGSAYDSLVYKIFPPSAKSVANSIVVAFTSVNSGDGVTHVVESLLLAMRGCSHGKALCVDMEWLKTQRMAQSVSKLVLDVGAKPCWTSGWESRKQLIQHLRTRSQYVAIDCPALSDNSDVLSLAPLVDGIVLIVQAEKTKRSQILNAERQIEAAGGKLLGLVLNKRRYPIPEALYKLL